MVDTNHHAETTTAEYDCSLVIHAFRIAIAQVDLDDLRDWLPKSTGRTNCPRLAGVERHASTT